MISLTSKIIFRFLLHVQLLFIVAISSLSNFMQVMVYLISPGGISTRR